MEKARSTHMCQEKDFYLLCLPWQKAIILSFWNEMIFIYCKLNNPRQTLAKCSPWIPFFPFPPSHLCSRPLSLRCRGADGVTLSPAQLLSAAALSSPVPLLQHGPFPGRTRQGPLAPSRAVQGRSSHRKCPPCCGVRSLHLPNHPTSWSSHPIFCWSQLKHHPPRQGQLFPDYSWKMPPKYLQWWKPRRKALGLVGLTGLVCIIHAEFHQTKFVVRFFAKKCQNVLCQLKMHRAFPEKKTFPSLLCYLSFPQHLIKT